MTPGSVAALLDVGFKAATLSGNRSTGKAGVWGNVRLQEARHPDVAEALAVLTCCSPTDAVALLVVAKERLNGNDKLS